MTKRKETWEELRLNLKRFVRTKVDADVSEDLVHDILLNVIQNEDKFKEADNPTAWLYTVAKNKITDYYRKRPKINAVTKMQEIEEFNYESENVMQDFSECLRPLVERLEPKYREAMLRADFNGAKQAEAAKKIGITLSAMKSRIQRARTRLKTELLNCCSVEVDRFGKIIDYTQIGSCNKNDCC